MTRPAFPAWTTLSKSVLSRPNVFLTLELHQVGLPDGGRIDDWPWLITPEFSCVVARTDQGLFPCLWQTKYAIEGVSLSPPGGFVDAGEDPLTAAKRELLEETGYEAKTYHPLGAFPVDANRGAGIAHCYLATGATQVCAPNANDLEEQQMVLLDEGDLRRALDLGEFKALAWACAVALALLKLRDLGETGPRPE